MVMQADPPEVNFGNDFKRNAIIDLLETYSIWLEDHGYMDVDWRAEEPLAINEFLNDHPEYSRQLIQQPKERKPL